MPEPARVLSPLRIAVASDLHCHGTASDSQSSFLVADALRDTRDKHPIESLLHLIRSEAIEANLLLCPGDISDKVCVQGLHSGWDFLKEVQSALGAKTLAATLGNHDVDSRRQHDADPFKQARGFRPNEFPVSVRDARKSFWNQKYYLLCQEHYALLVLNSTESHYSPEEAERGGIEESTLEDLSDTLNEISDLPELRMAMVHHHPVAHDIQGLGSEDILKNGDRLLELLQEKGFALVVHGHKHHPRIRYAPGGAESPVIFAAGSLSATSPYLLSNTRNLFHLIELFSPGARAPRYGQIRSWEFNYTRGWTNTDDRSAQIPAVAGFGCRADLSKVAREVAAYVENNGSATLTWDEVVTQIPDLDFLIPTDLASLSNTLAKECGLRLWPKPPERPVDVVVEKDIR